METLLLVIIVATLVGSFCCSISESALYSIPPSYVKVLEESGSRSGRILASFKEDMGPPISAILIINTVANTLGPAVSGAIADDLWGQWGVLGVAAGLAVMILFFGEITPKLIGVNHAKAIAPFVAVPILIAAKFLAPLLWVSKGISSAIKSDEPQQTMSHEEVKSMAEIGTEEGALDEFEGEVIQNVIGLDEIIVREILTPRVVVFRLREDLTVGEVEKELPDWSHSRVPIYPEDDPEHLSGYILQRDVFREAVRGNKTTTLKQIARQLPVVPELMRADRLLLRMIDKREHICAVVDEHGSLAGIVTLEDTMEELVGKEIVDEYDAVADLRTFAGLLRVVRNRRRHGDNAMNSFDPNGSPQMSGISSGSRLEAHNNTTHGATAKEPGKPGQKLDRVLREARKLKAQRGGGGNEGV